uniref:liprin-beta-1-like n=1 Tax=Myxine glutinosa TaxID=7769 RepID=UPI00358EA3F6
MASEPGNMLAAALRHIDGIISVSKVACSEISGPAGREDIPAAKFAYAPILQRSEHDREVSSKMWLCENVGGGLSKHRWACGRNILQLVEELRAALELLHSEEQLEVLRSRVPNSTVMVLLHWLQKCMIDGQERPEYDAYMDRLCQLEADRKSLKLQVSVLTDQVEAQEEKIRDLENCIEQQQHNMATTETMLEHELFQRTSLESQKLELMAEISSLKLNFTLLERDRSRKPDFQVHQCSKRLIKQDFGDVLSELLQLRVKVSELEGEKSFFEMKMDITQDELMELQEQLSQRDSEVENLQTELDLLAQTSPASMSERLQDIQIVEDPSESVCKYRLENDTRPEGLKRQLHGESVRDADSFQQDTGLLQGYAAGLVKVGGHEVTVSSTTPWRPKDSDEDTADVSEPHLERSNLDPQQDIPSPWKIRARSYRKANSMEDVRRNDKEYEVWKPRPHTMLQLESSPIAAKFQTLPTQRMENSASASPGSSWGERRNTEGLGEPRAFHQQNRSKDSRGQVQGPVFPYSTISTSMDAKKKGKAIRRLFGKLRRTQSVGLNNLLTDEPFSVGCCSDSLSHEGMPSQDEPRSITKEPLGGFPTWTTEQVCAWLYDLGLGMYVRLARQWIDSGQTLLQASPQELERELSLKQPLHRKKLTLALQAIGSGEDGGWGQLDYTWVTSWLDDVGLQQYKETFHEARVDGRMLHYMTVDDLLLLKVTSQLHHVSIKRAIQVLRLHGFRPDCFCTSKRTGAALQISPCNVSRWSNSRIMAWMRSIDLAEYAANLRGSGVHGALMVLEPRFTVETLASMLSIAPSKSLLRRHLSLNFCLLVGRAAQQHKRDMSASSNYMPLIPTAKIKPKKSAFTPFGVARRRRPDDPEELVCSLDLGHETVDYQRMSIAQSLQASNSG